MKLTLESTPDIYLGEEITRDGPVLLRKWIGATESGVPVHAYIAVVSPQTHDPEALDIFERELVERTVIER